MSRNFFKRLDEIERRLLPHADRDEAEFHRLCKGDYNRAKSLLDNLRDAEFPPGSFPRRKEPVEQLVQQNEHEH
jgi:hypothetical protein